MTKNELGDIYEALEDNEGRVDVVDGDYGMPAPNKAMQLQTKLETAFAIVERQWREYENK